MLVVLGGLGGLLPLGSEWRLFSYHPSMMGTGTACFVVAALIKKLGGLENTRMHGILSFIGVVCWGMGFAVIYYCKVEGGKEHYTTDHSWYGLFTLASSLGLLLVGSLAIHPDYGMMKKSKEIRFVHKMFGRVCVLAALGTMYTGLSDKLVGDMQWIRTIFAAGCSLAALAMFVGYEGKKEAATKTK